MRAAQISVGVIYFPAILIEYFRRQRILTARLEPTLVRIMNERGIGNIFSPELIVVEEITIDPLDKFA